MAPHTCFTRVLNIVYKNILKKMCYICKISVNVLNEKTDKQKSIKIKGLFVCFMSMGIKRHSFFPASGVQRILGECDASIHSIHTQKSSGMN